MQFIFMKNVYNFELIKINKIQKKKIINMQRKTAIWVASLISFFETLFTFFSLPNHYFLCVKDLNVKKRKQKPLVSFLSIFWILGIHGYLTLSVRFILALLHYGGKNWMRKVWDSWCILNFNTSNRKQRCKSVAVFRDFS